MQSDIKNIKKSGKVILPADKTTNLYKVSADDYNKLLHNSVTNEYRKAPADTKAAIDKEARHLSTSLNLADRMQVYTTDTCFVTLKDHKENFKSSPSCRLINPAKTDMGKISKQIMEKIVSEVTQTSGYNLWKNTKSVIDWFKPLQEKQKMRFIQFDIESFYPSISETLLEKALAFSSTFSTIKTTELDIIKQSRKSLLFDQDSCWIKKSGGIFDVTMGSYDFMMKLRPVRLSGYTCYINSYHSQHTGLPFIPG